MSGLDAKVAIVSGAGSGMGLSHVRSLVMKGARVLGFDLAPGQGLALQAELGPERFRFILGDVRLASDWERVVATCTGIFGRPNVLVNNAGVLGLCRIDTVSEESLRSVIDVNQVGVFLGMRSVVGPMREAGGGSIINIASTAGVIGFADNFSYVASKWAVRGMTKAAAADLAGQGIRINAVCPGETDTPMLRESVPQPGLSTPPEEMPLGRWARPEEVSAAVVFLASDDSSYITGIDLLVDGGYTAW